MIGMAPIESLAGSGKPAGRLTGSRTPAIVLQVVADTGAVRSESPPLYVS